MILTLLIRPAATSAQNAQVVIDEAMPDSIPVEILEDWNAQGRSVEKIKASLPEEYQAKCDGSFESACHWRRVARLKPYASDLKTIMFCSHHNFGAAVVGYHDNTDSLSSDWDWENNSALCIMNFTDYYPEYENVLSRNDAVIRDPCISFDGKKVLFAISGKGKGTGYKIYEMTIEDTTSLKQLTFDPEDVGVVADFEPCYLPNGDIMFTSTRNFVALAEAFQFVTNMFLMNSEGKYLRQVGFDQAHTFYPQLMDDGTVLYTRWEFNDRGFESAMGLFTMNPDGCHQTEFFGNQTRWPFTIIHARPVPKTTCVIAVAGGIHAPYSGELMMIDRSKGTNGEQSITMIAPVRETAPVVRKSDMATGNVEFLFQNPYPLDKEVFLVSWRKEESENLYRIYFMDVEGNRELLAWGNQSLSQPVLLRSRKVPGEIPAQANYADSTGSYTMQNVYHPGEAMKGITNGTARSLRVVALHYRAAGSVRKGGTSFGAAPSGVFQPAVFVPVSAFGASWDAKEVLGEAKIFDDGSAAFTVPARTPVYFQVIDTSGYCIASMRSWSTLMPGETFACVGCHENKIEAPPTTGVALAGKPQPLDTLLGIENRGFDYGKMVQPILDRHCVRCHTADHESGFNLTAASAAKIGRMTSMMSYTSLTERVGLGRNAAINICTMFSPSEQQPPYSFGSSQSGIFKTGGLCGSHHDVQVTDLEKRIVACWIDLNAPFAGYYNSYMSSADSIAYARFEQRREKWAEIETENIREFLAAPKNLGVSPGQGSIKTIVRKPEMGYLPLQHKLILNQVGQGNFTLVTLNGRVVYRTEIDGHFRHNTAISLPSSLSRGLYVARFTGCSLTLQRMVSVVR